MEDTKGMDTQLPGTAASGTQIVEGGLAQGETVGTPVKKKRKKKLINAFYPNGYREIEEDED